MRNSAYLSITCLASTLILTACGGGGGSSGAASPSVPVIVAPTPIAMPAITPIVTGNVGVVSTGTGAQILPNSYAKGMGGAFNITTGTGTDFWGNKTVSSNTMPVDPTLRDVTLTFGANSSSVTANVAGIGGTSPALLPNVVASSGITIFGNSADTTGITPTVASLTNTLGGTSLSSSFTGYVQNKTTSINASNTKTIAGSSTYYYGGQQATAMPTTGSATYNGTYKGEFVGNGYAPLSQTGSATMTANFGSGTVSGSIANISHSHNNIAGSNNILVESPTLGTTNFNGTITGTQFTGTSTTTGGAYTGNGAVAGGFFGAGAAESTGVTTNRLTNSSGKTATMNGMFGMKK